MACCCRSCRRAPRDCVGETRSASVTCPETYSDQISPASSDNHGHAAGGQGEDPAAARRRHGQAVSNGEHESVESFRTSTRVALEDAATEMAKLERESALVTALVDARASTSLSRWSTAS